MAFMLGSFTSGLFSGINEVQGAFARNEQAKQEHIKTQQMQMQMDAAKDAKAAMDADAAKKALGNAAAPQAVSTGQPATTPAATPAATPSSTGGKTLPKIDLNSVPQPDYLNGVTTRHNLQEQTNPGTDGVTPAQPQQPQQPSGGSELIGTAVPSQNEHDNTPQGPLPQGPMALTTDGIRHLQPGQSGMTFSWDRGLSPTGPYAPTGVAGQQQAVPTRPQTAVATAAPPTSAPHYLPGQTPAWGPRRALTPWGARPPVQQAVPATPPPSPVGQAMPVQPQQPGIANQQQPLGQQILSAVSPF